MKKFFFLNLKLGQQQTSAFGQEITWIPPNQKDHQHHRLAA